MSTQGGQATAWASGLPPGTPNQGNTLAVAEGPGSSRPFACVPLVKDGAIVPGVIVGWGSPYNPMPWGGLGPTTNGGMQFAVYQSIAGRWRRVKVGIIPGALKSTPSWWSQNGPELAILIAAALTAGAAAYASAGTSAGAAGAGADTGVAGGEGIGQYSSADAQALFGDTGYSGGTVGDDVGMNAGTDSPVDATGGGPTFQGNLTNYDLQLSDPADTVDNTAYDGTGSPDSAGSPQGTSTSGTSSDPTSPSPSTGQTSGTPSLTQLQSIGGPIASALSRVLGNALGGTAARAPTGGAGIGTQSNSYPFATYFQSARQEQLFAVLALGLIALMCFGGEGS